MYEFFAETPIIPTTIVSGYLAYLITNIGTGKNISWQEILLRVISFGTIATVFAQIILVFFNRDESPAETLLLAIIASILMGAFWRKLGDRWASIIFEWAGIYNDDHQTSSLHTLTNTGKWSFIAFHLKNGITLECDIADLPTNLPLKPINFNDDGIIAYITSSKDSKSGVQNNHEVDAKSYGTVATYIPLEQIVRMEVAIK